MREPPSEKLKATIVVPSCGEPLRRPLELFESLIKQESLSAGELEVLVVINNGPDDRTASFHTKRNANILLSELPLWRNRPSFGAEHKFPEETIRLAREIGSALPLFLIDKFSEGKTFSKGGIGAARDRGLAEAVSRFLGLERNGLMIFLDADVRVEDPLFVRKAIDLFERRKELIAGAGGLMYRADPDALQPVERKREIKQIEHYLLLRRWQAMNEYLHRGTADLLPTDAFIGACMLARAYEAAAWGGFKPISNSEDAEFGKDGRRFASKSGQVVEPLKSALHVVTALRYQHWMGREFDPADDEVHMPFTEADYAGLKKKISASENGKQFLTRLEDPAVLLYQDLKLV